MIRYYLEFEKPIEELELKIDEMKRLSDGKDINLTSEIKSSKRRSGMCGPNSMRT